MKMNTDAAMRGNINANTGDKIKMVKRPDKTGEYDHVGGYEYNWIRRDGTYVLKDWASRTFRFSRGLGLFRRKSDQMYNYADADGKIISDSWFSTADQFNDAGDPAVVHVLNADYNWLRTDGTLILKDGAQWVQAFSQGWGLFQRNGDGMYNFVDADGSLLSGEWFAEAMPFGKSQNDPAAVKRAGGRWNALYGRKPNGKPDLSKRSVAADSASDFMCGLAVVEKHAGGRTMYGYVDASMNAVGPGDFPFTGKFTGAAEPFDEIKFGGKWAKVWLSPKNANLMSADGNLAFDFLSSDPPIDMWLPAVHRSLMVEYPDETYEFPASKGWAEIRRLGIGVSGEDDLLEGKGGRLTLRRIKDRNTGVVSKGLVAKDSSGNEHIICAMDVGRTV